MTSLIRALHDSDTGLLPILAKAWGVDARQLETNDLIASLEAAMLDPERAGQTWSALTDAQRGAVQMLISAGNKQPAAMFFRMFGEIRPMGAAKIERERPHENPANVAEALFYRGLIARTFETAGTGPQAIIYIPDDLAKALPVHLTSYDRLDDKDEPGDDDSPAEGAQIEPLEAVENIHQADTSIVDDLTTLLAYLQLHSPLLDGQTFAQVDLEALAPYLLSPGQDRLVFLLGLVLSADVVDIQAGRVSPKRAEARRWLAAPRTEQIRRLAEAWQSSAVYHDLWHVPGLVVETEAGAMPHYNPAAARTAVIELLAHLVPRQAWWSVDDFIDAVKESDPDFQRPGGDYDSWYIRNESGDYLRGFESWDAVDGALLEYTLTGPLHWLGLVDAADGAARLTAYGRAFLRASPWPNPAEQTEKIILRDDGVLVISRKVSRIDRFQAARFTTWGVLISSQMYTYKLDARGVSRGTEQGINIGHIAGFISKNTGDTPLPPSVARLLESWKAGPTASVTMERLLVLRTTAPETLDFILETPALRRYLGAQLGPMAVIVRADQWEALRDALGEHGIEVEIVG